MVSHWNQVLDLSRKLGMDYQMAYRSNGAAFLMPAVVNWKVGHYAALIREENGHYLLQDPTFINDTWATRRALEAEASGYFLVLVGNLPPGWRTVSEAEGKGVWGKGAVGARVITSTTKYDKTTCPVSPRAAPPNEPFYPDPFGYRASHFLGGMAVSKVSLMLASLNLEDNPVGYAPPLGPAVLFTATYNQYESGQPANFSYSNLGQKWTFNWLAYLTDNPGNPSDDVSYYVEGGGSLTFTGFNGASRSFAPEVKSQAILTRTSANSYSLLFPDGSEDIFSQPTATNGTSRNVFLTEVIDPQGNSVQITYDRSIPHHRLDGCYWPGNGFFVSGCRRPPEDYQSY